MTVLEPHLQTIARLCQLHKVDRLFVFGSVLSDNFHAESDIDFLVKFGEVDLFHYFDNFMDFKEALEKLLQRRVDLVEEQTLKNPVLRTSIDKTKKLIYGPSDRKVAA